MEKYDLAEITDSYVCGIADAPLLGDTIGGCLDQAARRWGDREALVSPSHGVAGRGRNLPSGSMRWPRAFSRSASNAARGSASGR